MIDLVTTLVAWVTDPAHWSGANGIPVRLLQHLAYAGGATLVAAGIAVPLGVYLGHIQRFGLLVANIANVGRAVPTYGIILVTFFVAGFSAVPVFFALVALAVPPMLTNAYVGIGQVDRDVRNAARGTGMTGAQVLRVVELPLALPLVMAGVRTSAVQVVATAGLAALVGFGGLGRLVVDGIAKGIRPPAGRGLPEVLVGAAMIALLSILTELVLTLAQRAVTPPKCRHDDLRGPEAARVAAVMVAVGRGGTDSAPDGSARRPEGPALVATEWLVAQGLTVS